MPSFASSTTSGRRTPTGDEQRHGETDARDEGEADDVAEGCALRQTGKTEPYAEPCEQRDTDEFADYQAKHHTERDVARDCILEGFEEISISVHEGEQRDDQVGAERVKEVGDTLGHRQLFSNLEVGSSDNSGSPRRRSPTPHGGCRRRRRMRRQRGTQRMRGQMARGRRRRSWRGCPTRKPTTGRHPRARRAGCTRCGRAISSTRATSPTVVATSRPRGRRCRRSRSRRSRRRRRRWQDQEEDLHRLRDTITEQGNDADGERNVGGHRDAPPVGADPAGVESDEDQRRHDHAAERSHRRECRSAQVGEFAADEFLLISSPTTKKKTTIKASLTHASSVRRS